MNKRKLFGTLIAVIGFAILVIGATFAWLTYNINATNGVYNTVTSCFNISSSEGNDINTTLNYVTNPTLGASTSVTMTLASNCDISANGIIKVNVLNTTSANLLQQVSEHCENPNTLETLYNYNNVTDCINNGGEWVSVGRAFKYAIYNVSNPTSSTIPLKVGYITQPSDITLYSVTLKPGVTYTYYIYFWLDGEVATEVQSGVSFAGTIHTDAVQNGEYINPPELVDGLIPVKLSVSGDTVTTVATTDPEWYDYDNKKWANAVLVKASGVKTRAQNSVVGTVIDESDILAYYVWIPRYSYKVWQYTGVSNLGQEREIDIKFISQDVKDTASANGRLHTHPAFTFGDKELSGIWVGKFSPSRASGGITTNNLGVDTGSVICNETECDNSQIIRIIPNVTALRSNRIASEFYATRFMETSGNVFGLTDSTVDSHIMKNSEWGAVAYLSHSKYGINSGIRLNNNSNYTTGCGASEDDASSASTCDIEYGTVSVYPQSTTGNVTGIFDIAGGGTEHIMGHWGDATTYGTNSGFSSTYKK